MRRTFAAIVLVALLAIGGGAIATTAYQAGRWQQFVDGGTEYLMYLHMDGVAHPRLEHIAWSGTVLPITDPWWNTHYPPNGWRCHCRDGDLRCGNFPWQHFDCNPTRTFHASRF